MCVEHFFEKFIRFPIHFWEGRSEIKQMRFPINFQVKIFFLVRKQVKKFSGMTAVRKTSV